MGFKEDGYLITDKRSEDAGDTLTWETQTDWEGFQEKERVEIENGTVKLESVAIPDSEVVDDWADGNVTSDRDTFDETAYQGPDPTDRFNPVERPAWAVPDNVTAPSVTDEKVQWGSLDGIETPVTFDPTEMDLIWRFDIDLSDMGTAGGDIVALHLMADTDDLNETSSPPRYADGYVLMLRRSNTIEIRESNENHSDTTLVTGSNGSGNHTVEVTRSAAGDWELFIDESSQGTATDTSHTNPIIMGVSSNDNAINAESDWLEVYQKLDE